MYEDENCEQFIGHIRYHTEKSILHNIIITCFEHRRKYKVGVKRI